MKHVIKRRVSEETESNEGREYPMPWHGVAFVGLGARVTPENECRARAWDTGGRQ